MKEIRVDPPKSSTPHRAQTVEPIETFKSDPPFIKDMLGDKEVTATGTLRRYCC